MNFLTFPVSTTNIFPLANSHAGGQLLSEFNLRSRESVGTDPNVKYIIGPSYAHSLDDYALSVSESSSSVLVISPGRALVNGHYVESLAPININIADANTAASQEGAKALSGKLAVGLKMFYSMYPTVAGSAIPEDENTGYYKGIQVVIVPYSDLKLPKDVPDELGYQSSNMDLLLGTCYYRNGSISNLVNNESKIQSIDASRVSNIDSQLEGNYISAEGLNKNNFYVFNYDSDKKSWWCEATDSLMIWDDSSNPYYPGAVPDWASNPYQTAKPRFKSTSTGVYFEVDHKQPDHLQNSDGQYLYFRPMQYPLPNADTSGTSSGVVTPEYTQYINQIKERVDAFYVSSSGKMRGYMETRSASEDLDIPSLYISNPPSIRLWNTGDYIVVGQDLSVSSSVDGRYPSTMYLVKQSTSSQDLTQVTGEEPGLVDEVVTWSDYTATVVTTFIYQNGTILTKIVDTTTIEFYPDPLWITGGVPYATETGVGGFLNVPQDAVGNGYVYLDSTGHLRVLDFDLLLLGVRAYQLGDDRSEGSNISSVELQEILDEYVNDRDVYPSEAQIQRAAEGLISDPNVITLQITLPTDSGAISIHDIGSKYDSSLYVKFVGTAQPGTSVTFTNCDKLRIDSSIPDDLIINLEHTNLYYDAEVLNACDQISNMTLWYRTYDNSDPHLSVDGMTIRLLDTPQTIVSYDAWSSNDNDMHYMYAVKDLTFDNSGNVIGLGLLVGDNITTSDVGKQISVESTVLPQSSGLNYPAGRMTKVLKVTGSYVTGYWVDGYFRTKSTQFSLTTSEGAQSSSTVNVQCAFYTDVEDIDNISGVDPSDESRIDPWMNYKLNYFKGGVTG